VGAGVGAGVSLGVVGAGVGAAVVGAGVTVILVAVSSPTPNPLFRSKYAGAFGVESVNSFSCS
jgi:hypothetical protein